MCSHKDVVRSRALCLHLKATLYSHAHFTDADSKVIEVSSLISPCKNVISVALMIQVIPGLVAPICLPCHHIEFEKISKDLIWLVDDCWKVEQGLGKILCLHWKGSIFNKSLKFCLTCWNVAQEGSRMGIHEQMVNTVATQINTLSAARFIRAVAITVVQGEERASWNLTLAAFVSIGHRIVNWRGAGIVDKDPWRALKTGHSVVRGEGLPGWQGWWLQGLLPARGCMNTIKKAWPASGPLASKRSFYS